RVDGHPLLLKELRLIAEVALRSESSKPRTDAYHDALNERIQQELLYREALRVGGITPDLESAQATEKALRAGFPDEKAFLAFLSAQGFDLTSYRAEILRQEIGDAFVRCELDAIPPVSDEEALRFYQIYGNPASLLDKPSPALIEHWRYQVLRKKRAMSGRELLVRLSRQAKIERLFEPGACVS